jgi:hypothetical protein
MAVRHGPTCNASDESGAIASHRGDPRTDDCRRSAVKMHLPPVLCCGIYAVLAMMVFGHFGSLGPNHMVGNGSMDAIEQIWWLEWTAFAVTHSHSLFLTHWQNYPAGQNFGVNGSMLALGVVFLPITKLFGPVVTWNIALRLAVAVSASSMFLVLRRWIMWWPAAFAGGLLYGFSAYTAYWGGGGSYLFLIFVPFPPLIFLLLHEVLVRQNWRPARTGALLGAVCTLQFFISTEILAGTVMMGAIASALFIAVDRHALVDRWRYVGTALISSFGVGCLLLSFPVLFTFAGPQHINGVPASPAALSLLPGDLLAAIVPSGQWLDPRHLTVTGSSFRYTGAIYLGIPLIVTLLFFALFFRKRRAILFAGTMALIAFVLSLGPRLSANGHQTPIRLPFVVLEHLPVVEGFLPTRFSLFTGLFAAVMFALGLDELWRRSRKTGRFARLSARWSKVGAIAVAAIVAAVAIIPLVPGHTHPTTPTTPGNVPSFFASHAVDAIPPGSVVLAYPYPDPRSTGWPSIFFPSQNILLDQAVADMRFKLIGGYGWFPSPSGHFGTTSPSVLKPQSVQTLFDVSFSGVGTPAQQAALSTSNLTDDLRVFLRTFDVQTVIVLHQGGHPANVVSHVTAAIGPPTESGGVTVWLHVRRRLAAGSS